MADSGDPRGIRLVLRTGAAVFLLSALWLLVQPELFLRLLGLPDGSDLVWSMRMIAITLIALTGNMAVVSWTASPRGVRSAGVVMLFSAGALGVVTLLIPAPATWFTVAYALVGFAFSTAYTIALVSYKIRRQ